MRKSPRKGESDVGKRGGACGRECGQNAKRKRGRGTVGVGDGIDRARTGNVKWREWGKDE